MALLAASSSDKVTCTSSGILSSSSGPFTISLFVKCSNNSQTNCYLLQSWSPPAALGHIAIIYGYVAHTFEFYSQNGTGTDPRTGSQISVNDTNWHHICYRKSGSGAGAWDYFLDGVKTSINGSISFAFSAGLANINAFVDNTGSSSFAGALARIACWNIALSDRQVASLAKGIPPQFLSSTGEVLRWELQGTSTSKEPDLSANSRNGTITGTTIVHSPSLLAPFPSSDFGVEYTSAGGLTESVTDTLSLSDSVIVRNSGNNQNLSDAFIFTDSPTIHMDGFLDFTDNISFQDSVFFFMELGYSFQDSITLTEQTALLLGLLKAFSDAVSLADALSFGNIIKRLLADNLLLTDAFQQFLSSNIFSDQLSLQDSLRTFLTIALGISDVLSLTDGVTLNKSSLITHNVSDSLNLSDGVSIDSLEAITTYLRRYLNDVI